jgi:hypothetical protein
MLPTKFPFIWPNGFRGEELKISANQKQESPVVVMFVNGLGRNEQSLQRTFHRRRILKIGNQKQELPVAAMFVNGSGQNVQSLERIAHRCFLPSFSSFGQTVSEEKIFKNRPIRNMNCLWWPCLLMDRDEMSILYRGPSIDASYQVSVHLVEGFQRRKLKCEKSGVILFVLP